MELHTDGDTNVWGDTLFGIHITRATYSWGYTLMELQKVGATQIGATHRWSYKWVEPHRRGAKHIYIYIHICGYTDIYKTEMSEIYK